MWASEGREKHEGGLGKESFTPSSRAFYFRAFYFPLSESLEQTIEWKDHEQNVTKES